MKALLSLAMLVPLSALAAPEVKVSGFGTIGVVTTDSDEFGYRADFSRPGGVFDGDIDIAESTNLGVQFDIIASDEFDSVVQFIYRDQDDYTLDSILNLAFIRYSPNANWKFRIGRTAYDLFFLTEFRDIGYAYTWAHVPSEIYGVIPHRHLDGADITYSRPLGDITFSGKVFYGQSEFGVTAFSSPNVTPLNLSDIRGVAVDFHGFNWDIAFNHTQVTFDSKLVKPLIGGIEQLNAVVPGFEFIWPDSVALFNDIDLDNRDGSYTSVSGQYRFDNVTTIAEFAQIKTDSLSVKNVKSGYASAIYHAGEHNFFASFAFSNSEQFDLLSTNPNLPALAQIPGALDLYQFAEFFVTFYNLNQHTVSAGWRWDFADNMSFKLQWDYTEIDDEGSTFWQPREVGSSTNNRSGHVNALFANVSFLF